MAAVPTARRAPTTTLRVLARPRVQSSVAAGAAVAAATDAAAASAAPVAWWLAGTAGAVFGMVVLGGVTRLTRSGLSMTDWSPAGGMPPRGEEEWAAEFAKYKQFPEYARVNSLMTLDEFKSIYYMEWGHRMAGRAIGLIFGLPMVYFMARGQIPSSLRGRTLGMLALGGAQGGIGWWMVKSGLEQPRDAYSRPRVSAERLATHVRRCVRCCAVGRG